MREVWYRVALKRVDKLRVDAVKALNRRIKSKEYQAKRNRQRIVAKYQVFDEKPAETREEWLEELQKRILK